jgi:hypothetical protein
LFSIPISCSLASFIDQLLFLFNNGKNGLDWRISILPDYK